MVVFQELKEVRGHKFNTYKKNTAVVRCTNSVVDITNGKVYYLFLKAEKTRVQQSMLVLFLYNMKSVIFYTSKKPEHKCNFPDQCAGVIHFKSNNILAACIMENTLYCSY